MGFAPATLPPGLTLLFAGEALGVDEVVRGEAFTGAAGGVLSRLCVRAGIDRKACGVANCVSCRPPNDWIVGAPWEAGALVQCRQYFDPALATPTLKVVVPLGATALDQVLNLSGLQGIQVKNFHGTVSRDPLDRFWVVPTFHPSHLQRGAMNLLEVITGNLKLASKIAQHGFTRKPARLWVDPPSPWFGQWVTEHLSYGEDGPWLAVDTEFTGSMGKDKDEITEGATLTRVNVANRDGEGITVLFREPYISQLKRLLAASGWTFWWNKDVDLDMLGAAGFDLSRRMHIDLMWLWHYVQSDLPRGLGFVAPFYSDFGAWKHWAKIPDKEGEYAAADALQTYRCTGIVADAQALGVWEVFLRECHDRDQMVLKPASAVGVPIDRPALEAFHAELQGKLTTLLEKMQATTAEGCLKPKAGYAKKPKGDPPVPPKSIFGAKKKGGLDGPDAKLDYLVSHTVLVERLVEVDSLCCETCSAEGVTAKHRCPKPKGVRRRKKDRLDLFDAEGVAAHGVPSADTSGVSSPPAAALVTRRLTVPHWYWRVPFNPDARAQLLAYIESTGRDLPRDRKTGKTSTSKKSVTDLLKKSGDQLYQLILDWKAVQKVDSTYALATLNRLDADNRLHSTFTFAPSTLRDSSKNPNLQNVVSRGEDADLASGFRRCVQARDGIPEGTPPETLAAWEAKYA